MGFWLDIVVAAPAHSGITGPLTYESKSALSPGQLVRVPLGRREVLGVVWGLRSDAGSLSPGQSKSVLDVLEGLPALSANWQALIGFTANYYQRSVGEVALAALPPQLRELDALGLARRLKKAASSPLAPETMAQADRPALSAQQAQALELFEDTRRPALLFGATGSGKTEVYLRAAEELLQERPQAQVLMMVPEINLTPQLETRLRDRFAGLGPGAVVALHSGLTPAQRLKSWLAAHTGQARLILGTRMAVLASLPQLQLIVVDEEHDPSYKQQEGARYSARDLAVYRAHLESRSVADKAAGCRVMLGSATPSLETWQACLKGRYLRLDMPLRIGASGVGEGPEVRVLDMSKQAKGALLAPPLMQAIAERVSRGEQSLVFLNRRGYAPVLACHACGWKSQCPHCSAYRVFHKVDRSLRCHHCGYTEPVPRGCPDCGNVDITPVGRGTEQLEEQVAHLLSDLKRPDGSPVRVLRIDADSARGKGVLQARLAQVHAGHTDVLVGTQMVTKGHDFRHITLVAAVNPDSSLYSSDFRAPERLFALLMQAAGRAGRQAQHSATAQMWVQTFHPQHPLFDALRRHDYAGFAQEELHSRQSAGLPPFSHAALLRAEAASQELAQDFLRAAAQAAAQQVLPGADRVQLYPAVPMPLQRLANVERAQMLIESASRPALQQFMSAWQPVLAQLSSQHAFKRLMRWALDVDPLSI
ncbi:MAG: primosomal protein N' [Betaproteobacteria bacterium]|nr:primosomal protein N' [Betaproteobacteria bacterium]